MPPVRTTMKIRTRDRGLDAFVRRAKAAANVQIRAGVLPREAQRRYQNGATVGEVAAYNELGTPKREARPFLGSWFDSRGTFFVRQTIDVLRRNLRDGQAARALRGLGDRAALEVRASLRRFDIYDTGLLDRSITVVVDVGRAAFAGRARKGGRR